MSNRNAQSCRRSGVTVIETLILIAIVVLLVAVLTPAVCRVRGPSIHAHSKHNLSRLGVAMKHYEGLGHGNLIHDNWQNKLLPYLDEEDVTFTDPSDKNGPVSYALTNKVVAMGEADNMKIAMIESDDSAIVINNTDCNSGKPTIDGDFVLRHLDLVNALMYGGNVRTFEREDIDMFDVSYKPFATWWLPASDKNTVCDKVIKVAGSDALD